MSFESALQRVSELAALVEGPGTAASRRAPTAQAGVFEQALGDAQLRQDPGAAMPAPGMIGSPLAGSVAANYSLAGGLAGGATPGGYMPGAGGYMPAPGGWMGGTGLLGGAYPAPGIGGIGGAWPIGWPGGGSEVGQRIVQLAQREVGVAEAPSGSNDSARIREYRTATTGAENTPGPWCAYFVSWLARNAGAPIGAGGNGTGYVPTLEAWGRSSGRWVEPAQQPQPGDIVIFNWGAAGVSDHTGIVERVDPDGTIHTIEGNSSNAVRRRDYEAGSVHVKGYVRAG